MKISELIAQLQYCQQQFGDLDVVAYKNGQWLDSVEKIVHLEAVRNEGPIDPKATSVQREQWSKDPQMQPNSGWLALKHIRFLNPDILEASVRQRKLYIGPKIVVTP